jgi:hypothetical protein
LDRGPIDFLTGLFERVGERRDEDDLHQNAAPEQPLGGTFKPSAGVAEEGMAHR